MAEEVSILNNLCISKNDDVDSDGEEEVFKPKLHMKATAWMKLYQNQDTPENRAKMRDISIKIVKGVRKGKVYVKDHGTFTSKFAASAPYYFFLSTIDEIISTYNEPFSLSFHEIIDYTSGEIVDSLHITRKADILWLVTEYMLAAQNPKMMVLYQFIIHSNDVDYIDFDIDMIELQVKHHANISILKYKDGYIRIIISTACFTFRGWQSRTQGLWISPLLPPLSDIVDPNTGESVTNFKHDFIEYLKSYGYPELSGWEAIVQKADCTAINVFFIGSVPGLYSNLNLDKWGHRKLRKILSEHAVLPDNENNWPIVAQSSHVGVFGNNFDKWIGQEIVNSMSREKKKVVHLPDFKFVYPSRHNYDESYDKEYEEDTCLYFDESKYVKQKWILKYLHQWKSDKINRTLAMPNCKFYTRISPDETEISWALLTSANLTKGAWGQEKKETEEIITLLLHFYEAGVLYIPKYVVNQKTLPIKKSSLPDIPVFLIPYDLPLISYNNNDEPLLTALLDNGSVVVYQQPDDKVRKPFNSNKNETVDDSEEEI